MALSKHNFFLSVVLNMCDFGGYLDSRRQLACMKRQDGAAAAVAAFVLNSLCTHLFFLLFFLLFFYFRPTKMKNELQ